VTALADAGPADAGFASGFLATAHELGAALGVAVFTAIAEAASTTGPAKTGPISTGAGFAAGYHRAFLVAAGAAAVLAVLTLATAPAVRPAPGTRTGGPH
jgi:hypothetical protein